DAPSAELAPESALLHSAPRRVDAADLSLIHPNDARPQAAHGPQRAKDVTRPDAGREAVLAVVRQPHGTRLVVERHDDRDGTEDLFARDACRCGNVVEDRRFEVMSARELTVGRPPA